MPVQVAFLRAINVGKRRVKMERLRQPFEELGFEDVSTFIASGNVIFRSPGKVSELEAEIEDALESTLGFEVRTFVRPASKLATIVGNQPFGKGDLPVHVGFLKKSATAAVKSGLAGISNETDTVTATGPEVFWLARGGMGRATLSGAVLEKALGQATTFRSLKMLRRLQEKVAER